MKNIKVSFIVLLVLLLVTCIFLYPNWIEDFQSIYNRARSMSHLEEKYSRADHHITSTTLRVLLVSSWRSGSTFLSQVLNSQPDTFLHMEPLHYFRLIQMRDELDAKLPEAKKVLREIVQCNFQKLGQFMRYAEGTWPGQFRYNTRWMEACGGPVNSTHSPIKPPPGCYDTQKLNLFCAKMRHHVIKTVRIRLKLLDEFLINKRENFKVILLVRDPRAMLSSRLRTPFCEESPDCIQPELFCADLEDDYKAAQAFQEKYGDRFLALRYEDFSLSPQTSTEGLFSFLGLPVHPNVIDFVRSRTTLKEKSSNIKWWSTERNSNHTPFKWRENLKPAQVRSVQDVCQRAMALWRYEPCEPDQVRKCQPLGEFNK